MLKVAEIFRSIAGEGTMAGVPMVFVRLSGCNLRCSYCDTKYAYESGNMIREREILDECLALPVMDWVCLTGGEPLMQDVTKLISMLHESAFFVALETNGTRRVSDVVDHLVVSPKRGQLLSPTAQVYADEFKYIIQDKSDFDRIGNEPNIVLQPVDNDVKIARMCVDKILENTRWRLSLQLHKLIGIR